MFSNKPDKAMKSELMLGQQLFGKIDAKFKVKLYVTDTEVNIKGPKNHCSGAKEEVE